MGENRYLRLKVGVLGAGNMGAGLVKGMVEKGFYPQHIYIYDPDTRKGQALKREVHIRLARSARHLASFCDVVILAVKPQVMASLMDDIALATPAGTLVVSIAAGIRLDQLEKAFKERPPVIRVMPNMPALVGEGVSAYCLGRRARPQHRQVIQTILSSVGSAVEVKEKLMDLVTALSGSGPAYFFLLASKLIEAGCELGMKAEVAKKLVYQTAFGSSKVLVQDYADPEDLIARVASKGGTTEAALAVFRKRGWGKIVQDAVKAAHRRSRELSGG